MKNAKVKGLEGTNWKGKVLPASTTEVIVAIFYLFTIEIFLCFRCKTILTTVLSRLILSLDIFLQKLIEMTPIKYHQLHKEGAIPRQYSSKYHIIVSSKI